VEKRILEHALMCVGVGLNWQKNSREKLDTIRTALVVDGILETWKAATPAG
jgi:hypothetical protein